MTGAPNPRSRRRPRGTIRTGLAWIWSAIGWTIRALLRIVLYPAAAILFVLILSSLINIVSHTERNVAFRDLASTVPACRITGDGWPDLASPVPTNDEALLVDQKPEWGERLRCAIQRHSVPGYADASGPKAISYDLAFVEFQEDGQPYLLRDESGALARGATGHALGQLDALLARLRRSGPHFVVAFAHGWRHDASIGDGNVADLRVYAAHAARSLVDRCTAGDTRYCGVRVTAVYIGWRGARANERRMVSRYGRIGEWIGDFAALFTLFDRKPVSEAIAPSAISALRAIQQVLQLAAPIDPATGLPPPNPNRMIVFGHSLGGNMLMTGLKDQVLKEVLRHKHGAYLAPPLGDLVVLINPASEAANWTLIQRAVWQRFPLARAEKGTPDDYALGRTFFVRHQRPVLMSVTAARDWPPGGLRAIDCDDLDRPAAKQRLAESQRAASIVDYDTATNDAFPLFKGDLRPLAGSIGRWATYLTGGQNPDLCGPPASLNAVQWLAGEVSTLMREAPFNNTDIEQTRTIGNLDPPRAPRGTQDTNYVSSRPFGTTHEMRRRGEAPVPADRGAPGLDYGELATGEAACPAARGWLDRSRATGATTSSVWDSDVQGGSSGITGLPALRVVHGFESAGLSAITRANDPFWNVRAFDTALARHNGYMLPAFICTMYQLVLDDVTEFGAEPPAAPALPVGPPAPAGGAAATPSR